MNIFKSFLNNFLPTKAADPLPPPIVAPNPTPVLTETQDTVSSYLHKITIPANTSNVSGSGFAQTIMNVAPDQNRENMILNACLAGAVPDFMRQPQPVTVSSLGHQLSYWVLPDVLCIGNDTDYLRTPLNPLTARKVGEVFNCVLPTKKMAMQIWAAAPVKLNPIPNGPPYTEVMQETSKFIEHNTRVQNQLQQYPNALGNIITGHKKDVVYTKQLSNYPNNVAIYGWFYPTGAPIQGLNPVSHDHNYKDYSHGIRLISRQMILDGQNIDFYDLLRNTNLCSLISDEDAYDARYFYK